LSRREVLLKHTGRGSGTEIAPPASNRCDRGMAAPSPGRLRRPTSPRRGEVKAGAFFLPSPRRGEGGERGASRARRVRGRHGHHRPVHPPRRGVESDVPPSHPEATMYAARFAKALAAVVLF